MSTRTQAQRFLAQHGLTAAALDADAVIESFIQEMERGLAGDPSSLAMIPTYITIDRPVPADHPVIVMDAGGTNLRAASITFAADGTYRVEGFRRAAMPGTEGHVSGSEFFDRLADFVAPLADGADRIGFCFSYATEINPECDGRLLHWTKEIQAPEVVGEYIGAGLAERLAARGKGRKKVVILNDTIATLLAGKSVGGRRQYSSYLGVIEGTGSNTAYVEQNAAITKKPGLPAGAMAINLESGNFARCPRTDIDLAFDATMPTAGRQVFEKMFAGGYLGGVALHAMRAAAADGLISSAAAAALARWTELETPALSAFLWNPHADGPFGTPDFTAADRELALHIGAAVIRRAALLLAINVAAPAIKSGAGTSPLHPVCVVLDGSTYYRTKELKSLTEEYLRELLTPRGIFFDTIQVEEAPTLGAAVAGLTA